MKGYFSKKLVEKLNIFGKIGKILEKVHKIEKRISKKAMTFWEDSRGAFLSNLNIN